MQSVKLDRFLKGGIAAMLAVLAFLVYDSIRDKVVNVGDTAPEFTITTDNGKVMTTASFGGKLLVLNFWATWCPPCVQEMPSLDQFQRTLADKGVVVLGISVDKDERAYKAFLRKAGVAFHTARDPQARINADYGTFKYPETYIINAQGRVVRKYIGPENWSTENMLADVRSLL